MAAVNRPAAEAGLGPGMALADARARGPGLAVVAADPAGDAASLSRLAAWCGRYTPWTSVDAAGMAEPDGSGGLWLDITGCAHLFGGEAALLADLTDRLAGFGLGARAVVADTPGAAWAWARFGPSGNGARGNGAGGNGAGGSGLGGSGAEGGILRPGAGRDHLAPLPVAALRLTPALVETLDRLGLRRIGTLYDLPRPALAARFGDGLARRLDQALGRVAEPISPRRPAAPHAARLAFPEPVARPEAIAGGLDRLLERLCARLTRQQRGARRLELTLYRVDGSTASATIGTSRPAREPAHLGRLFAPRLETLDPAPGVEILTLAATATEPFAADQVTLPRAGGPPTPVGSGTGSELAALVDRLANRLGGGGVLRFEPRESHWPERAVVAVPVLAGRALTGRALAGHASGPAAWPGRPRPLRLLPRPEAVEVEVDAGAVAADGPPRHFRWRRALHHVARAEGPERIAPEWWGPEDRRARTIETTRDYFRIEDTKGRRLWLFHAKADELPDGHDAAGSAWPQSTWYVHGVFG